MSQTDPNNVEQRPSYQEELQVMGEQLLSKVKELIHERNVRRIIITLLWRSLYPLASSASSSLPF